MAASPAQRQLADALTSLKALQDSGKTVVRSSDLSRQQRESLLRAGFLRSVVKGWYMPSRPGERDGDTTAWYAVMRDFIRGYCTARFGDRWYVSPEYSLLLHAGNTVMPRQVVVHSIRGKNSLLALPDDCSLSDYCPNAKDFAPTSEVATVEGIKLLSIPLALIRVSEPFFRNYAQDAQIVLHGLRDVSDLNRLLLEGGHSVVAGRLIGALRAIGRSELADNVFATMQAAGFKVTESNPFTKPLQTLPYTRVQSPYVLRMRLMWQSMRDAVLSCFTAEPGLPADIDAFMADVEDIYRTDAYHSLSIEGYGVSEELIQRVATGDWSPDTAESDAQLRNAMAAHGYWLAHNELKLSMLRVLQGKPAGEVYRADNATWYRTLFAPSIDAGILKPADLAGYRNHQVYIKNAAHVPPAKEAVRDMMPELFDLLGAEPNAAVRAVLGHFMFVFIHPYMDGNGRLGRFLMNMMFCSGGYPWTVINVGDRNQYMAALNSASSEGNIVPFAQFVAASMEKSKILLREAKEASRS